MVKQIIQFYWLCFMLLCVRGANILSILHMAGQSHFQFGTALMKSLQTEGHNITVVSGFPAKVNAQQNYTFVHMADSFFHTGHWSIYNFSISSYTCHEVKLDMDKNPCHNIWRVKEIREAINSKKKLFDVVFVHIYALHECFHLVGKKLNVPVIGMVTSRHIVWADYEIGNPFSPAYTPHENIYAGARKTFLQRLKSVWDSLQLIAAYWLEYRPEIGRMYRKYDSESNEYKTNYSLIFYNAHSSLLPRPVVPNAIEVGGLHIQQKAGPLPKDMKLFIENAENGVILFSLGSVLKGASMKKETEIVFRNAFASIPQRVIWKYEGRVDGLSSNVMISKWVPQRDILGHANVKAFIGHCGIAGMYEAVYEGVPMVLMPVFGDQLSNAAILEEKGVGVMVDILTITEDKLINALDAVINNTRYKENMRRLSRIFKDRPRTPQKEVVYWTEYVLRYNGAPHMKTAAVGMPWYQYLLLDVILFLLLSTAVIVYCFYRTLKCCALLLFQRKRKTWKEKKSE